MASCAAAAVPRSLPGVREIRVLRWVFKRANDAITCELGLTGHDSAYELQITARRARPAS